MNKKELLIRSNRRKKEFNSQKEAVEKVLNLQLNENDFLELQHSDNLRNIFFESFKDLSIKPCETYSAQEEDKILSYLDKLYSNFKELNGYLILKQSEIIGVISVSLSNILKRYKQIIEFDGDSLCFLSNDRSIGVYIDYFEENQNGRTGWYYEVCIWGLVGGNDPN